jgi:hypothetical protein
MREIQIRYEEAPLVADYLTGKEARRARRARERKNKKK